MSGELLSVRLLKPWGDHKAGKAILVDRLRAVTLEVEGIGSIEPPDSMGGEYEAKAPSKPPRDKMVRASKTKGKK